MGNNTMQPINIGCFKSKSFKPSYIRYLKGRYICEAFLCRD